MRNAVLKIAAKKAPAPAETAAAGTSIGHKGMLHAARIMALVGIDLYSDPVHLERARREFAERTTGNPYRSPLPAALTPPRYPAG